MKKAILTLAASLLSAVCFCQDFKTEFGIALEKKDTSSQREILSAWESQGMCAEIYPCWLEYYFQKAEIHRVALLKTKPEEGSFMEVKDSSGTTVAFLCPLKDHDMHIMLDGIAKMDEGISRYQDRLDLRSFKMKMLSKCKLWPEMIDEVAATAEWGKENGNRWVWPGNGEMKDPQMKMIKEIQIRVNDLYACTDSTNTYLLRALAESVLACYPENVQNLTNLAISYMIDKEFDNALVYLMEAYSIDPEDPVVLNNIAYCHSYKENLAEALKFYKKACKYGTAENKEYARFAIQTVRGRVKELKKSK